MQEWGAGMFYNCVYANMKGSESQWANPPHKWHYTTTLRTEHSTKIYDVTAWRAIQTSTMAMHADGVVCNCDLLQTPRGSQPVCVKCMMTPSTGRHRKKIIITGTNVQR